MAQVLNSYGDGMMTVPDAPTAAPNLSRGMGAMRSFGGSGQPSAYSMQSPYVAPTAIKGKASNVPGMPDSPDYQQVYNPNTQSLLPGFEAKQNELNKGGFNQFQSEALRKGPSAWATLANQQNQNSTNTARDQARAVGAGNTAQTESNLASSGGLSSGARERAQEGGARSTMSSDQALQRQGIQNQYQIGSNDEQNRMQMLSQLPGMEQQQLNAWEGIKGADLANQIAENQSQNAYNMGIYNTQAQGAAAGKTADAQKQAADDANHQRNLGNLFGAFW